MSAVESTRRDLVEIKGWSFVPVDFSRIDAGANVMGRDAKVWHVAAIVKGFDTAEVTLRLGAREQTVTVGLYDPVHVLDHCTGARASEYHGMPLVRSRKGMA